MSSKNREFPGLFVGDWHVMARGKKSTSAQKVPRPVDISIERGTGPNEFTMSDKAKKEPSRSLIYDDADETLQSQPGDSFPLNISFWRHPSYDMIFAMQKSGGSSDEVWSARRAVSSPSSPPPGALRCWQIVISEGRGAAKGYVSLEELVSESDARQGLNLFGLFHSGDKCCRTTRKLYDILVYDADAKCFKSVFDVRSLNYWPGNKLGDRDRLFATFDNRSSIPEVRFGDATNVGELLPFEKSTVAHKHGLIHQGGLKEEDDPDVGVWVGEPPP